MNSEIKIVEAEIHITDVGTGTHFTTDGVTLSVTQSGGCPADDIIKSHSLFGTAQEIAEAVLADWLVGYEGGEDAARENQLTVEVNCGDAFGIAQA